jgi:hypothetical protein
MRLVSLSTSDWAGCHADGDDEVDHSAAIVMPAIVAYFFGYTR